MQEVVDKVAKLSDDNLQFILDMINRFMQPEELVRNDTLKQIWKEIGRIKSAAKLRQERNII